MTEKQIELIMANISEKISDNIKPVEYLMTVLNIGKESAYRRMRGEIPFTFDEISELSLKLGFSVDEIIGKNMEERVFFDLQVNSSSRADESFLSMLEEYYKYMEIITSSPNVEVMASLNRISLVMFIEFDSLFKLYYYNWIHQTSNVSLNHLFSDTVVPYNIMELRKKFIVQKKNLNNLNLIIDREIFLTTVREIQYYYNRKLITEEDVLVLKEELISLLKKIEIMMQRGTNDYGSTCNYYLSLLDVETNTNCSTSDNNIASLYWLYPVNVIAIYNQEICYMQKKWTESLKKFSVLITLSNEILQAEFIAKQKEFIEDITNELYHY
ncbi:MAG: hypothetical protein LBT25_01725 [Candidatus Symbiothrix sp.]|jgi:hypothetical protein|nr:hypothetical protein [Candidatus Symbiothrix sp.]